jgi:DNA-directed RNA polymerase specialized sigma24 family protein
VRQERQRLQQQQQQQQQQGRTPNAISAMDDAAARKTIRISDGSSAPLQATVGVSGWNPEAAAEFAALAHSFEAKVTLAVGNSVVDGKSVVEVMALRPAEGSEVTLEVAPERLALTVRRPGSSDLEIAVESKDTQEAFDVLLAQLFEVIDETGCAEERVRKQMLESEPPVSAEAAPPHLSDRDIEELLSGLDAATQVRAIADYEEEMVPVFSDRPGTVLIPFSEYLDCIKPGMGAAHKQAVMRLRAERRLAEAALREAVQTVVATLPGEQRQVLELRLKDRLSYEEIATKMRLLNAEAAEQHYVAVLAEIRSRLKKDRSPDQK